jgi:DNA-binding NtrC family response regulator
MDPMHDRDEPGGNGHGTGPAPDGPATPMIGESPAIRAVRQQVARLVRRQPVGGRLPPVLLLGETGTGKGCLAREIHAASARAGGPFVGVNCAAIPETLLEGELFGYERGAFTDARQAKPGLFQAAHRGVLFLDEVGGLPVGLQAKLLTAIEERAVRRLGSVRVEAVDMWVVAATSEPLVALVREQRFRADLYHRLSAITFTLPPLRERGGDILRLADHFLAQACRQYGLPPKRLSPEARAALLGYPWPGNVRELANVMERVVILADEALVPAEALGLVAPPPAAGQAPVLQSSPALFRDLLGEFERAQILAALEAVRWNTSRAAAALGLPRNTLRYRMEKHGLRPADPPHPDGPAEAQPPARFPAAPGGEESQLAL